MHRTHSACSDDSQVLIRMTEQNRRAIYINGRFLGQNHTGVQRYSREVVVAIDRLLEREDSPYFARRTHWHLLAPPGTECDLDLRKIQFSTVGTRAGHLWEQLELPKYASSGVLLSPANCGPVRHRRQIVVIHDAAIYKVPAGFTWKYRVWHKVLDRLLARSARIATVSKFSRGELAGALAIPADDIILAPNGTDHLKSVVPDCGIVDRLNLTPGKYFVTLGLSSANKNIGLAVKAYDLLSRSDTKLVVVGESSVRVARAQTFKSNRGVILAGRLSDQEVMGLLRSATALLFPSRYEGFGLPPLEAMAVGCPVLASTAGAVVEVCGGAALHFHPDDAAMLADLMSRVLDEPQVAGELRARGLRRPGRSQWESTAAVLMAGLQRLASELKENEVVVGEYDSERRLPTR
jgi:glycosyltransferase involved in cell wall biosynthesis